MWRCGRGHGPDGDREGASFFSRLAATSYDTLEVGHGGYFFNTTWTPLGANVAGPEVTQQFFQRSRWLRTLARNWEGNFTPDSLLDRGASVATAVPARTCWSTVSPGANCSSPARGLTSGCG